MPNHPLETLIKNAEIRTKGGFSFSIDPTGEQLEALKELLGVSKIGKLRFEGKFEPLLNGDISLDAVLGATVVQPCSISLSPVTTRIDSSVSRVFVADIDVQTQTDKAETELLEDAPEDFLPDAFSLFDLLIEALALEIPEYPRADGAELENAQFTEPGKKPMIDDDARPFAALEGLKAALEDKEGGS